MASKKIGLVLALDKDKEFRDALKACKDEVKAYKESVEELDDKFKKNEATIDDLKKKNEDLTKKQEAYAKQLDAAKTGLEHANTEYKKQADHLEELRKKLKDAEDAQQRMKDEGLEGTEAYKKQTEEVDKLRDAVQKQTANVATAEQKVNSWNREVRNAEQGIEQCNKDLEQNAKDMDELERQTDQASDEMKEFADKAGEAATESGKLSISIGDMVKNKIIDLAGDALRDMGQKAIEAAKYVVEVGSSFEAQMSKVGAISGASGADLEKLTEKAKEMGATTKFSATESGEALEYMAMAGWKTNDMVEGLDGVMNLAAASGADLGTTSDIVTDALTAFGETAGESGRLADIMAAASTNANTNVEMMGETFKYAAPIAGALGYSMEDTAVAVGLMANAGIKASQAGTSLRSGLTRMMAPTKQISEAMEAYGIAVTDTDGKMLSFRDMMVQLREKLGALDEKQQTAAASAIFGKNAMSGWLAVINSSDADFDKLTQAVDNSNGAAARMAETMQDNLSGKITIMQSALEGLGIAAYEYISGPLQGIVEGVTNIINGITEAITPQKTELEQFIDDIEKSNEQVEKSLDHARKTVEGGEAKAAEIEAYKGILDDVLTSCEDFNLITLDNGRQAIVNSAGEVVESFEGIDTSAYSTEELLSAWAEGGLNTAGIDSSSKDAQDMIGFVSEKADTVESRLAEFAAEGIDTSGVEEGKLALVQIFDDLGVEVESFETDISEAGAVEMDTSGISEGTEAIITYLDETTGSVESFKTNIENLNTGEVNLSQITSEFGKVEDSVRKTYVITDEFTKSKISTMVDALGGSVEGLATAWNEQTGELTASKEELDKWFDTAKEVAMYEALQSAMQELNEAWGTAAVQAAKANSAVSAALEDFNREAGTTFETAQEAFDWVNSSEGVYNNYADTLNDAVDVQIEANSALNAAEEELTNTSAALDPLKEKLEAQMEATRNVGTSAEEAAGNIANLDQAEEDLTESTYGLTEGQQASIEAYQNLFGATEAFLRQQEQLTASSLAEWCDAQVENLKDLEDEYQKLVESVAGSMQSYVAALNDGGQQGLDAVTQMNADIIAKKAELEQWVSDMETLGKEVGNGFSQNLYDELLKEGPEKGHEKVRGLVEAMNSDRTLFEDLSTTYDEALAIQASATTLASYSSTGKAYEAALQGGFQGTIEEFQQTVETGVSEAASAANVTAEGFSEAGETSGKKTEEGIESTSNQVKDAAESMLNKARDAANAITATFLATGQKIPQEIKKGVNMAQNFSDEAMKKLMESSLQILKDSLTEYQAEGREIIQNIRGGIESESSTAVEAVRQMVDDAKYAVDESEYNFESAGGAAVSAFARAISNGGGEAVDSSNDVAQNAFNAAEAYTSSYENLGFNMMAGLAGGINNGASQAINAAANAAANALAEAQRVLDSHSPSREFEKLGGYAMEGFAEGIEGSGDVVVDSVIATMSDAKQTAANQLQGITDLGDFVGGVTVECSENLSTVDEAIDDFQGTMAVVVEDVITGLQDIGDSGATEIENLIAETKSLQSCMESTSKSAANFYKELAESANQALESALAMQRLQNSMDSAQNGFLDMTKVVSGLFTQMTALSEAVSGMDLNPAVNVQIGNKAIESYITKTSVKGITQAQKNLSASQGKTPIFTGGW